MGVGEFKMGFDDLEAGFGPNKLLYPGIGAEENALRWGFIRKVYGILSVQLVLTTIVAGSVVMYDPIKEFFLQTPGLVLFLAFVPLISKLLYLNLLWSSCLNIVFLLILQNVTLITCYVQGYCLARPMERFFSHFSLYLFDIL